MILKMQEDLKEEKEKFTDEILETEQELATVRGWVLVAGARMARRIARIVPPTPEAACVCVCVCVYWSTDTKVRAPTECAYP